MYKMKKRKGKKNFCMNCLQCFSTKEILTNHREVCLDIYGKKAIKMHEKGCSVPFGNYHEQLQVPFVICTNFESNLKEVEKPNRNNTDASFTDMYQYDDYQYDCSYGCKFVCIDHRFSTFVQIYQGKNAVQKFAEKMLEEVEYCKEITHHEIMKLSINR